MKITVLMENTSPKGLLHEHGLSLHLEYRGGTYLLDAGASGRLTVNAAALGIDLAGVGKAVLSHGHYDHADGLRGFFSVNAFAPVLARPAAALPQYDSESGNFIGIDPALPAQYPDRFDFADGPRDLAPGLHLIPDAVAHEQSLVAETDGGLVVLNSCCHAGAGYIVRDILARFPGQKVYALVGGFHLMGRQGPRTLGVAPGIVRNLARWLGDELGVERLCTGHCTGEPAFSLLREELGSRVEALETGRMFTF